MTTPQHPAGRRLPARPDAALARLERRTGVHNADAGDALAVLAYIDALEHEVKCRLDVDEENAALRARASDVEHVRGALAGLIARAQAELGDEPEPHTGAAETSATVDLFAA